MGLRPFSYMDRFLLAENPMRPGSGLWVIHLLEPKAIVKCIEGHQHAGALYRHYQYKNSDGVIEEWTLSIDHLFTQDMLTPHEQIWEPMLDRAWRWFRAYMEFEDKNIDDAAEATDN
jgi:hypothetical protein